MGSSAQAGLLLVAGLTDPRSWAQPPEGRVRALLTAAGLQMNRLNLPLTRRSTREATRASVNAVERS
jgi:hypothetical protein